MLTTSSIIYNYILYHVFFFFFCNFVQITLLDIVDNIVQFVRVGGGISEPIEKC